MREKKCEVGRHNRFKPTMVIFTTTDRAKAVIMSWFSRVLYSIICYTSTGVCRKYKVCVCVCVASWIGVFEYM